MTTASAITAPEVKTWRSAVDEATRVFKRGEVIGRAWFEAAFGVDADGDTMTFLNMLGRFKEELLERHRMDIVACGGFDQRIVLAEEQADVAIADHAREYQRSRAKVERRLRFVAEEALSPQEQRRLNDNRARLATYLESTEASLESIAHAALPAGAKE